MSSIRQLASYSKHEGDFPHDAACQLAGECYHSTMYIPLVVLGFTYLADLLLLVGASCWQRSRLRTTIVGVNALAATSASAYILGNQPGVFGGIVFALALYRALNYTRIALGRMNHHALLEVGRRSILWLDGLQLLTIGLGVAWHFATPDIGADHVWYTWSIATLLVGLVVLRSTIHTLSRSTPGPERDGVTRLATRELPTVTVAVSSHGDRAALVASLDTLISSSYPKLEILAMDDGPQPKRTPEVIKELAQKGVRFIEPAAARDGWLARNQAYDRLAKESTSDYIIFMGADVHLEATAIRALIEHAHARGKSMLSIAPLGDRTRGASLSQTLRYIWEFAPPRRAFGRPPVLSNLWLIERETLKKLGGLSAVKRAVTPEAYFAQRLVTTDAYGFVRSTPELGVVLSRDVPDHFYALLRSRYPALHRHIEFAALLTCAYVFVILAPVILIISWVLGAAPLAVGLIAIAAYGAFMFSSALIVWRCRLGPWPAGLIAYPTAAMLDFVIVHVSLWQYELGDVTWRHRSAVLPVMQVEKRLPKF